MPGRGPPAVAADACRPSMRAAGETRAGASAIELAKSVL